jgi:hypothetical protein
MNKLTASAEKDFIIMALADDLKNWEVLATCKGKYLEDTLDFCKTEYPNLIIKVYEETAL